MKRRLNGPLVVSAAIHVVVGAAILHAMLMPRYIADLLRPVRPIEAPTERIRYIETRPPAAVAEAPRSEGPIRAGVVKASPRSSRAEVPVSSIPPRFRRTIARLPGSRRNGDGGSGGRKRRVTLVQRSPASEQPSVYPPARPGRESKVPARGIRSMTRSTRSKERDPRD